MLRHRVVFALLLLVASQGAAGASESDTAQDAAAEIAAQTLLFIEAQALAENDDAAFVNNDARAPGPEVSAIRPKARRISYQSTAEANLARIRPKGRPYELVLPRTRWEHRDGHKEWTRTAMKAVLSHGKPLTETVPSDYRNWCPAYAENDEVRRAMFWVGFMSALAKHESTYREDAVGGGGRWYGLLQILPSTARLYQCEAKTGEALKDGGLNLSCATRIMSKTVGRDKVIHGFFPDKKRKYRGVTQDWGPMHSDPKRAEMAAWTRKQAYCISRKSLRPKMRPASLLTGHDR